MAILTTDIKCYLSGGAANTNPNLSLGGQRSNTAMDLATLLNNLWDDVAGSEASAGDTEYRCVYLGQEHASLPWQTPSWWLKTDVIAPAEIAIALGLDPAGNGDGRTTGVATSIANESSAPAGVSFSKPVTQGTGLAPGNINASNYRALWIRRSPAAGAAARSNVGYVLGTMGDTAA